MELKEFITDTVSQIAEAVTELNKKNAVTGLAVNPAVPEGGMRTNEKLHLLDCDCSLTNIEFNLSLTTSENKGSGAKVGVFASIVGAGASSSENAQSESVSKIRFSLPVLLPTKSVRFLNRSDLS